MLANPYNTIQYHVLQFHTIQYQTIPLDTLQYIELYTIRYKSIQFDSIPYNQIQYHTNRYNTIQFHAISSNIKQHWRKGFTAEIPASTGNGLREWRGLACCHGKEIFTPVFFPLLLSIILPRQRKGNTPVWFSLKTKKLPRPLKVKV